MRNQVRKLVLLILGVTLSAGTFVLGPLPLLALRRATGREFILWVGVALSALIPLTPMGVWIPFAVASVLIGVYVEARLGGLKIGSSGLLSLVAASGVFTLAASILSGWGGVDLLPVLRGRLADLVQRLSVIQPSAQLDVDALLNQMPSALVIAMAIGLWLAILGERGLRKGLGIKVSLDGKELLRDFRLPESLIWVALVATAGTFLEMGQEKVHLAAMNIFNVVLVLYFFQGLAVAAAFLKAQKVSAFWQSIAYLILVGQLFFFVSGIGFADYWLDFRSRLTKKSAHRAGEV